MGNKKYAGTDGLTLQVALNRIFELTEKAPLGGESQEIYNEAKKFIEVNLHLELQKSSNWNKVKDKLTAKQLLFVLEG